MKLRQTLSAGSPQVKLPNNARVGALCPYCKKELSVRYGGPLSDSERAAARAEEQRVIEATLRARIVRPQATKGSGSAAGCRRVEDVRGCAAHSVCCVHLVS